MSFTYWENIKSDKLRLLRSSESNTLGLCFELVTIPRNRAPPYTAVSYTWGTGSRSETIYLNGRSFKIRTDLWNCLYYLGYSTPIGSSPIWVDAICINQNDDDERSAQVRSMGQTYSEAAFVSVWFGLPHEHGTLSLIRGSFLNHGGFCWSGHILELASRPYWTRFWVVQEFLLNENVRLYCGGSHIELSDFEFLLDEATGTSPLAYSSLLSTGKTYDPDGQDFDSIPALALVETRRKSLYFRQSSSSSSSSSLQDLLEHHRRSRCGDQRDRVFSLLALVPSEEQEILRKFFPDYSLSIDQVLIITLAHLIQQARRKDLTRVSLVSYDIFTGLGVDPSLTSRARLLEKARKVGDLRNENDNIEFLAELGIKD
ncbi:uncharacterized protein FFMR_02053 [Fusarium fujikuroi]|nr:uncharacterized protein FFMR_02053 [Fusarium fujikuroi]